MSLNWNCDGSGPHHMSSEVRVLPLGGDGNLILCRACYRRELAWRIGRNRELAKDAAFSLPAWESLRVYEGAQ